MSDEQEQKKALVAFRQFVAEHGASKVKAEDLNHLTEDLPPIGSIELLVPEVLGVFLGLYPEHEPYRAAISAAFVNEPMFTFSKVQWNQTNEQLAGANSSSTHDRTEDRPTERRGAH